MQKKNFQSSGLSASGASCSPKNARYPSGCGAVIYGGLSERKNKACSRVYFDCRKVAEYESRVGGEISGPRRIFLTLDLVLSALIISRPSIYSPSSNTAVTVSPPGSKTMLLSLLFRLISRSFERRARSFERCRRWKFGISGAVITSPVRPFRKRFDQEARGSIWANSNGLKLGVGRVGMGFFNVARAPVKCQWFPTKLIFARSV